MVPIASVCILFLIKDVAASAEVAVGDSIGNLAELVDADG